MRAPTQARLHELLSYDSATGIFTNRIDRKRSKAGAEAGCNAAVFNLTYRRICIDAVHYSAHRLAWLYVFGEWPQGHIDHIDGNGLNNAIENLRVVSHGENLKNQRLRNKNTSGISGVAWESRSGRWSAQIGVSGASKKLGRFHSLFDAVAARKSAELKFGYAQNHGVQREVVNAANTFKQLVERLERVSK